MNTDDVVNLIGWRWDAFHLAIAAAFIGRAWRGAGGWAGITTRGGIVGLIKALLFGTNTPKQDNFSTK